MPAYFAYISLRWQQVNLKTDHTDLNGFKGSHPSVRPLSAVEMCSLRQLMRDYPV